MGNGDPVDPDSPLGRLQEPHEAPGQGGLPGARPAHNAHLSGDGRQGSFWPALARGRQTAGCRVPEHLCKVFPLHPRSIRLPIILGAPVLPSVPLPSHLITFPYAHPILSNLLSGHHSLPLISPIFPALPPPFRFSPLPPSPILPSPSQATSMPSFIHSPSQPRQSSSVRPSAHHCIRLPPSFLSVHCCILNV